jgi:hypothetical protein
MKKTIVQGSFNLRIGEILDGEDITEDDEIFLDKVTEEAETIPDKIVNNLKKDFLMLHECLSDYAGVTLPDPNLLFESPEDYDINEFELTYESLKPSIGILRKALVKNSLLVFKDCAIEVNSTNQIIKLQKAYINYLKEKCEKIEERLEKLEKLNPTVIGITEKTEIVAEEEEDGTK